MVAETAVMVMAADTIIEINVWINKCPVRRVSRTVTVVMMSTIRVVIVVIVWVAVGVGYATAADQYERCREKQM